MSIVSTTSAAVSLFGSLLQPDSMENLVLPSTSFFQDPILVSRTYSGISAKNRMFQWYQLVHGQGYTWRSKPGEINIIFIRGCDLEFNIDPQSYDKFSDLMVICGKKKDGSHFLRELRCTTKPGHRIAGGRKGLAKPAPGQYFYEGQPGTHNESYGALRLASWQKMYGYRDTNGDGQWSAEEKKIKSLMSHVNIHWVGGMNDRETVQGWSEGCFVVPMTRPEFLAQITPYFKLNTTSTIPVSLVNAESALSRLDELRKNLDSGLHPADREYLVIRESRSPQGWFVASQKAKLQR